MKRIWRLIFCMAVAAVVLSGCKAGEDAGNGNTAASHGKLRVVTTLFPYYDFIRQIAGDRVELTMIVPAGMDSHSFEPTPADVIKLQEADLIICNGGAMENWLIRVLSSLNGKHGRVVTMMDYVDVLEEEIMEGMEAESHDEQAHQDAVLEDDGHAMEIEYDEHIWTSPVNAMKLTSIICDALSQEDEANREYYRAHLEAYQGELDWLDAEFREVVAGGQRRIIVVGDKFPFRYLADTYKLTYRAAFTGCSTDTEPSAKTIAYLIDKVKTDHIPVIYYLELSSHRVSEIIGEETGAKPLLLHSCHNVTRQEFDSGVTYLELMEKNVENLREGLQ